MYHQTLMAGLRAAVRKPTNLAKVNLVRQEPTDSPSAFLERLMEAFRQYTPMDPQAEESRAAVLLAFVNRAAPDIRRKLQKIEGLGEQTIQDLLKAAEKRETPEREERIRREERELAEISKEDREHRAKENRKNPEGASPDSFCGDEGQNRIEGASRPPDGRKRKTKKAGPKEGSVRLLQRTGAREKRVP